MEEEYLRKITIVAFLAALAVLSFLILKPIIIPFILGVILAMVFSPAHKWLTKKIKSGTASASIICLLLVLIIVTPFWFLTPIIVQQSFQIYLSSQQIDFVTPLKTIFPSFFSSDQFSNEIGAIISSFITKTTNALVNSLSQLILNFPTLLLQSVVVFFTFFFTLRDKEYFVDYIRNLLPFQKEVKDKLFMSSKNMISSVIYGQIVIGVIQGVVAGFGFFIFGVNNALLFTLLAIVAGVLPIIGTTIVWLPIAIYFVIAGNTFPALGVTFFGLISNFVDNIIRPIFVSRYTNMHPLPILLGMIGGLFLFGILGFILGPLVIAYVFIILEIYRGKPLGGLPYEKKEE